VGEAVERCGPHLQLHHPLYLSGCPGLPLTGPACHVISRSSHIVSDPLALSSFVYGGQFFVLCFCLTGLLISSAYFTARPSASRAGCATKPKKTLGDLPGGWRRMTVQEDRQKVVEQIEMACREGARLEPACEIAGLDVRTVQRWRGHKGKGDGRPQAVRPTPAHALSAQERARLLEVLKRVALTEGLLGDNAFVASVFRTAKYRPEFPASGGLRDLQATRQWASDFVHWYNHDHHHSGICCVSPA
jgi:hypothetical protein